jgi:hypothetical protein
MRTPLLLCLLVLATWVDDALARTTPEPDDDAVAAANNDYLPPPANDGAVAQPAAVPGAPLAVAVPRPGGLATAPAAACPCRPDPLYLLMSLQR